MVGSSFTARVVAATRAGLDRSATPDGDAETSRRLGARLGVPRVLRSNPLLRSYLRGRTGFFDEMVLDAVAQPPVQVVIVGAGFDDRALRMRTPGARFIEVDHPATQRDKRRRLAQLRIDTSDITFVAIDLAADSIEHHLARELNPDVPSLVLCEGLLPYLPITAIEDLLRGLRRAVGTETVSHLALDLPLEPTGQPATIAFGVVRFGVAVVGERMRTVLSRDRAERLHRDAGWEPERYVEASDLGMPVVARGTTFVVARTTQ